MKSKLLIGAVALIAIAVFAVAFLMKPASPAPVSTADTTQTLTATTTDTSSTSQSTDTTQPSSYTMAMVATHNSASSCWAAINGNVYDLTNWINQHPGGPQRILALCGTDGSAAFNAQHGGQARPASELAQFLLGPLSP